MTVFTSKEFYITWFLPFFKKQSATISTGSGVMRYDEKLTRESGDERVLVPTLPQQSCQHVIEQRI